MKGILELILRLQSENKQLRKQNKQLRQQKGFLATKIVDQRYTIKQLKNKSNLDLTT